MRENAGAGATEVITDGQMQALRKDEMRFSLSKYHDAAGESIYHGRARAQYDDFERDI